MSKSHYIIEDVQSIYASINEETESVEEIDNFAGDVYAAVATSMLHEGYSASGILGFLSTASDEEILERFGDYDENFIAESTISEEYVNEQVEQLDEFVGAALRVLGAGAKAAKFGKGGVLSKMGAGLRGAGQALSRVAKQGPAASSVVRKGLSKLKSAAGAGLSKLKGAASKVGGALKGAAKTLIPGAVGFALGKATSSKSEAPKSSGTTTTAPPAPPKPAPAKTYAVGSEKMSKDQIKAKYDSLRSDPAKAKAFGDKAFAAVNPKLDAADKERARTRGTSATTNPLMKDFKSSLPDPKPKATAGGGSTEKKADEKVKKESFSANTVQGMMEAYSSIYNTEETEELQENQANRNKQRALRQQQNAGRAEQQFGAVKDAVGGVVDALKAKPRPAGSFRDRINARRSASPAAQANTNRFGQNVKTGPITGTQQRPAPAPAPTAVAKPTPTPAASPAPKPAAAPAPAPKPRTPNPLLSRGGDDSISAMIQRSKERQAAQKPAPTPAAAPAPKPMGAATASAPAPAPKPTPTPAASPAPKPMARPTGARPMGARNRMRMMDSYDMVLDYLLSGGHAETVEEAHYIMLRLEADHIQEIVETAS